MRNIKVIAEIKNLYKKDPKLAAQVAKVLGYKLKVKSATFDIKSMVHDIAVNIAHDLAAKPEFADQDIPKLTARLEKAISKKIQEAIEDTI